MYSVASAAAAPAFDVAALALCRGLGPQATSRIATVGTRQHLSAGKTLFAEGDPAENIYEVIRGTLRLCKLMPDGRRQITGFLSAGHLLGVSHGDLHLYTAEAITAVTLCRYPRARFDRLLDEVPGFARRLLAVTSDELRSAQDQMLLLGRKTAVEKIASFLLTMAERQRAGDEACEIQIPMGRADIADYLGLTVETVSRTLTTLKRDGFIAIPTPVRLVLRDRKGLEKLAAGEAGTES
ncbi:MAG TPA: helix-turn-helix domain-containing protein [Alphaproteobacteria bacterium]|nr:helix-turn-helix domain-containing protein [Alphaproteobacteria bacterium]